jgi:hypothetical protein
MPVRTFRKRPVEIQAVQWTGDNETELAEFTGGRFEATSERYDPELTAAVYDELHSSWVQLRTGDWVARGVEGEFYPVADRILAVTYEAA